MNGENKLYTFILEYEEENEKTNGSPYYYWSEYYSDKPLSYLECRNAETNQELDFDEIEMLIISKNYGFIEWLVEKNKIKYEAIEGNFGFFCMEGFDNTESLIMVLSIQEQPLDFLADVLK